MPRTYRPPKTRARAAADPANSEAAQRRAQRLRKRASARPGRSARHARSATRHRGKPKDEQVPLVKGARLTGEGHKAAARGEAEYQQLVNRFEGHVHLSRGRPAAANARLKLLASSSSARRRSSGSRPMGSAPVPTGSRRLATPPPRDDELASPSDSDSDSARTRLARRETPLASLARSRQRPRSSWFKASMRAPGENTAPSRRKNLP